jgi:hypothetical protein
LCPDVGVTYFIFVLALALILLLLMFLVYQGRTPKNKETVSAKILLNHIQMLALLSAVGAAWTDPFQTLLLIGGVTSFVDSKIIATDCAFPVSYYLELAGFMAIPFLTLIVVAFIYLFIYFIKAVIVPCFCLKEDDVLDRPEIRKKLLSQYVLAVTVVTFITYPAICIKVLEMFDCSIIVEGRTYLNSAPEEECGTSQYNFWLIFAYIMLIVYCIGAPIFATFMLFKFRKTHNPYVQTVLRFFYDGFKAKRYYWEMVIVIRKFLIVVAIIVGRSNPLNQIYAFVWIVQAALLAHIIFHPYLSGRQFRLELWSLLIILVTLGISLYIPTFNETGGPEKIAAYVLSSVVLVLNLIVILGFFFFILRGLMRRFAPYKWRAFSKLLPRRIKKKIPKFDITMGFLQAVANSSEEEQKLLHESLEQWWQTNPNYKRRRLLAVLRNLSHATPFASFDDDKTSSRDSIELPSL